MATRPDTTQELPPDIYVRRGQDEYWHALAALLPQGIAWPRWPTTTLMKVIRGLAGIMGFMDSRAGDMLERESDPRTTVEMLDQWERAWGLPHPCLLNAPQTIGERQTALVLWITMLGAQSRDFFMSVATKLGYTVRSIEEYRPFMVGMDRCGDNRAYLDDGSLGEWPCQIGSPEMRFVWTMHLAQTRLTWFRCGKGQCGIDPHLRISLAVDLECYIRLWRPAHTEVLFDYSGMSPPDDMAGTP
jgi:uncharacterized protein YmfQ (DUF2313 family)